MLLWNDSVVHTRWYVRIIQADQFHALAGSFISNYLLLLFVRDITRLQPSNFPYISYWLATCCLALSFLELGFDLKKGRCLGYGREHPRLLWHNHLEGLLLWLGLVLREGILLTLGAQAAVIRALGQTYFSQIFCMSPQALLMIVCRYIHLVSSDTALRLD